MARLTAQVSKDLNQIEPKILLGFSKRQLIWNGLGVLVGGLVFFAFKGVLSIPLCMFVMMIFAFPFFLVSIFQKEGLNFEQIAKHFFISQYRKNPIRIYRAAQPLNDVIRESREHREQGKVQNKGGNRK
jgi:hypothetical protein